MSKLLCICEGTSERNFVTHVLQPYFNQKGVHVSLETVLLGWRHPMAQGAGGDVRFSRLLKDLSFLFAGGLAYDAVTTLFDYYGLKSDWTGLSQVTQEMRPERKASCVEQAAARDLCLHFSGSYPTEVAKVMTNVFMHEYEGLMFSNVASIVNITRASKALPELSAIACSFPEPEAINDGENTAPSKRLISAQVNYSKTFHGHRIISDIGIDVIRSKCPHFHAWLSKIESI